MARTAATFRLATVTELAARLSKAFGQQQLTEHETVDVVWMVGSVGVASAATSPLPI
jgi:hypothetical protein